MRAPTCWSPRPTGRASPTQSPANLHAFLPTRCTSVGNLPVGSPLRGWLLLVQPDLADPRRASAFKLRYESLARRTRHKGIRQPPRKGGREMQGLRSLLTAGTSHLSTHAGPFLTSLAGCFVLMLCYLALRARRSKLKLDLPRIPGPRGRPLVGNLADILRPDFHKVMARWAAKYGEVYRINILGLEGVVVASTEAVSTVLGMGGHPGSEVPKHVQSYWALDLLWGTGDTHTVITGLNTDTWKTVHRAVAPCFNSAAVRFAPALSAHGVFMHWGCGARLEAVRDCKLCRQKFELVRAKAEDLAASLRAVSSSPVDVQEAGMRFTLDVIVLVCFQPLARLSSSQASSTEALCAQ